MEKGLEANPKQADFKMYLALACLKTGEGLKKARKQLSEVLQETPESLEALLLMAQVLEKLEEKGELKKIYKRILSLEPKNETMIFNLGVLEYEAGNLKASSNYLKIYLESHPKDVATHEIVFDIYKKQNNVEMAFKEAHVLVELRPKEIGPYYYIFDHLAAKGDYEGIIRIMEKGLEANPKQTDLRGYLVLAYLETGKEELAIEQIEKILKVRPEDIKLLLHLARLQEKREEYSKALAAYEKVLEISPDHEEAQEAYLRLRLKGVRGEGKE
jgi:Tfp pilus assembly protein PilF